MDLLYKLTYIQPLVYVPPGKTFSPDHGRLFLRGKKPEMSNKKAYFPAHGTSRQRQSP